jgi:hypothetical protein
MLLMKQGRAELPGIEESWRMGECHEAGEQKRKQIRETQWRYIDASS